MENPNAPKTSDPAALTRSTYERLKAEMEELTTVGRVEIAKAIEAARALGDLSENGDYHAAKDTQGKMESRIRQLQAMLRDATVVSDEEAAASTTVTTGSVVTVLYDGDDENQSLVVGTIEEKPEGLSVVSPQSPLGQSLMGKRVGDTVEFEAPTGTLKVRILKLGQDAS
ncbi:MAG: transcription elongation factor GreA [Acidimicrobiales bacterium]